MHLRNSWRAPALAALLAMAPTATLAQTIPSPFRFVETRQEAGLFAGSSTVAGGRFGFGPKGGTLLGGRWGIDLSGPLGFEGVVGFISGTRDVVNPAQVVGDMRLGEADVRLGTVDARLRFTFTGDRTWHGLAPFIATGGGMVFDLSPSAALDEELLADDRFDFNSSFFGTLGTGVKFFVTERIALRGDAVFSLWKVDTPPGFSDQSRGFTAVEKSEWVSGRHLTLAAVIRY